MKGNRGGGAWLLVACLPVLLPACAGSELAAEARGIRELIRSARETGAYRCAPGELALAESHVAFAQQELTEGDYLRARDHLRIADWNAREAARLSPPGRCPRSPVATEGTSADRDGDGLANEADKCPSEAEDRDGFQDDDGCADPDDDGDGIADAADRCPREAEDRDEVQDEDGCPDKDNDRDGVSDEVDRCPDKAEDADGFEDGDGCPDLDLDVDKDGVADAKDECPRAPGPGAEDGCPKKLTYVDVTSEKIELRQSVSFETAKPVIRKKSHPILDEVALVLKARPTMKVRVEGHTDSRGKRESNLLSSQARAEAVRAYLIGQGIAADRLEAKGFGPDQAIETNKTAAGREKNRRVEFVITQP